MRTFRIGLVIAALLGVADLAMLGGSGGDFPPAAAGFTDALLGVLTLIGVALAWRGRPAWVGVVAATRVVSALTALPAFLLNDVPAIARVAAAAVVALTTVVVILLVRTAPARAPVG